MAGLFLSVILTANLLGCGSGSSSSGTVQAPGLSGGGVLSGRITASGSIPAAALRIRLSTAISIASVTVWLQEHPEIRVVSNADGTFLLTGVPFGINRVVGVIESGSGKTFKVRAHPVDVTTTASEREIGDLALEIAQNRVRGILRDANGNPVANAELTLWGETFTTGPDGSYVSPPLPDAELLEEILVKQAGRLSAAKIVAPFTSNGEAVIITTLTGNNDRNKAPNAWLTSFKEPADKILPGEIVNLWAVILDDNAEDLSLIRESWGATGGSLASNSLPFPDDLKRRIPNVNLASARVSGVTWTAPAQRGNYKVEVSVRDPGGLAGAAQQPLVVFASENDFPPAPINHLPTVAITGPDFVTVNALSTWTVTASDADLDPLLYEWSSVPPVGVFASPRNPGSVWTAPNATGVVSVRCSVSELRTGGMSVVASKTVTVTPEPIVVKPGMIAGHVLDADTRQPIPKAVVAISGTNIYTVADEAGYFELKDLVAGTYVLIATKTGYKTRTYPGIVVPAQ